MNRKRYKRQRSQRLASEKAQIEALIEKHRPRTPKTPDEVNTLGTGKNANTDGQEGTEKVKPPHKKATKASQIETSQKKGDKANKGNPDTLLGDPMVNTKTDSDKAKEKGQKDKVGINDMGLFEFIFHGLPNPPDLEGMDEDISILEEDNPQIYAHLNNVLVHMIDKHEAAIFKSKQDFNRNKEKISEYIKYAENWQVHMFLYSNGM